MSDGKTPPLQDPGGLHGYKGMSPQLHDSGGLNVYSMNGGSHKMAEIVPQSPVAMAINNQGSTEMGLFPETSMSSYQLEGGMQNTPYIDVEPLNFNEQGRMYEEIKTHSPTHLQTYFGSLENVQSTNSMYDNGSSGYHATPDMFKTDRDNLGGYIEMLGNPDTLMNIKREKPDYNEHMAMGNHLAQEMNFPPNTCVADWNYYSSMPHDNNFQEVTSQSGYGTYNMQGGSTYNNEMMNNTQMISQLQTNVDIHNQSKKITQSLIGTDWSSPMFKSRLYSNLDVDVNVNSRKRKNESETASPKRAKPRRKKSNDIAGHSKTVASILMSNNAPGYKGYKNAASADVDTLDSSGRNELVTKLMDNLRTTVQFESFCLSFPRTDAKENAFRGKVLATTKLIQSLADKPTSIFSEPVPSNILAGASKLLTNFNMALENSRNKGTNYDDTTSPDGKSLSVEQVEEHLPHSMVWVFKMGDNSLTANWEGQFVAAVNPIQDLLSLSIFQFMPCFSGEGIKCLQQAKLSKVLANDIVENLQQFEVSRQLRCDICLRKIVRMYLYKPHGEQNEGCLILDVSEKPGFFQRWLHTSAEDRNKWRQRSNFISKTSDVAPVIWIGGLVSELNELVAMILACCPALEPVYKSGISQPFEYIPNLILVNGLDVEENGERNDSNKIIAGYRSQKQKRPCRKLGSNVIKLRAEIIEVLKSHSIMSSHIDYVSSNLADVREEGNADMSLAINLDEKVCSCLRDYVNYCCDSAVELNSILQQRVSPSSHGYYENDFDLNLVPGGNIDNITVGELISSRCSEVVYYSFCAKEIGQIGYERHCSACRKCRTRQFWHCYACERCSESRQVCEFCGHLKDDSSRCVVKPLSVFKSQIALGKLSLEDVKNEWVTSLNLPYDDIVCIGPPKVDTNVREKMEYNSTNAMIDQLGLLNPVGFLLGQPLIGASRKYRRYKVGQPYDKLSQSKSMEQSAGSACSVQ